MKTKKFHSPVVVMGLKFKNSIGLAAGFDKNAQFVDEFFALGFGFVEVGTVTPKAQGGSTKPRLFRLISSKALINRMGFNNKGIDYVCKRLNKYKKNNKKGIIGVNIGKNKETPLSRSTDDYVYCLERVYNFADYIVVNISSPNTEDLRTIQYGEKLTQLLSVLKEKQQLLNKLHKRYVPLVLKISPDLTQTQIVYIGKQIIKYKFDGIIATNTTTARDNLAPKDVQQSLAKGGLSGAPLFEQSNKVIQYLFPMLSLVEIPIIGVGGILSADDAQEKFKRGAVLVQLYTGLVFSGPSLLKKIIRMNRG